MTMLDQPIGAIADAVLTTRIRFGDPTYCEVMDFLIEEAWLLDHDLLEEWTALLADDVTYFMPVRQTVSRRAGPGFSSVSGHFYDDLPSIKLRVRRLMVSDAAYAEDPPSRTRRYVSNVRIHETDTADELSATSSLLLVRNRWHLADYDFVSCERHDRLRRVDGGFRIVRRKILVDNATLGTPNLAVFL
jgi:3-phenylpropionate/cinnamic acid dioxygenase small subunit